MKTNKINMKRLPMKVGLLCLGLGFVACNIEPDESDLYTATGETVETFLENDSTLSSFNAILKAAHLDKRMETYGEYTCFAPSNEAVEKYIDSLYNDSEAAEAGNPHNGLLENSLAGLLDTSNSSADSLCKDIAKYHLLDGSRNIMSFGGNSSVNTMLGRNISIRTNSDGQTVLNDVAIITSEDNEVTNGYVHKLSAVVPRSSRDFGSTLKRLEAYSLFSEALEKTGLADSITATKKDKEYTISDYLDTTKDPLYHPTECKLGYTIFAETDDVFKENGITTFDDLVKYANEQYGNCKEWYDYVNEKGIDVSTGTDYTNPFNALNMFVRYHILPMSMAQDQLVFEDKTGVARSDSKWNYVNNAEPQDYYETMLPHTLIKIWQPNTKTKELYINRYRSFNTLTDEVGTMGSDAMHKIGYAKWYDGIQIDRTDIMTYNGYVHPIKGILVYNTNVPNAVLHERLRFDATTFLPEFINNGIRYMSMTEVSNLNGGGSGARVAFPLDYFDNVISYTDENRFRYNVKGNYAAFQADAFQGWGKYDFAVKLPPVPSGTYELRLPYTPMSHGGMMQFYLGTTQNPQEMMALDIPLDVRIDETDPRIGWTQFWLESDKGIATDEAMRNRGYMRGPMSYMDHPDTQTGNAEGQNCRGCGTGNVVLRRILGRVRIKQSEEYWFRYKNVISDETDLKWQLDYIELVPIDVLNNDQYSEDWY